MAKTAVLRKADSRPAKSNLAKSSLSKAKAKTSAKNAAKTPVKAKTPAKPAAKKPVLKVIETRKPQAKPAKTVKVAPKVAPKAAPKAVLAKPAVKAKVVKGKTGFSVGDYVVYPTHGVGRIEAEESQVFGDMSLRLLVISFEKDRMTLRVPVSRASAAGLRHISGNDQMQKVFVTLRSRARVSRGMWSRRAQEYETKINSGNVIAIAEVVRDLHHNVDQTERSYSERMIYESALSRLVGELAAAEGLDLKIATDRILTLLRSKVALAA